MKVEVETGRWAIIPVGDEMSDETNQVCASDMRIKRHKAGTMPDRCWGCWAISDGCDRTRTTHGIIIGVADWSETGNSSWVETNGAGQRGRIGGCAHNDRQEGCFQYASPTAKYLPSIMKIVY